MVLESLISVIGQADGPVLTEEETGLKMLNRLGFGLKELSSIKFD
jgi:hypothetical protein